MIFADIDCDMAEPAPRRERSSLRVLWRGLALATVGIALSWAAFAQTPPSGQAVLNQGVAARLITKSDTTKITVTRGLYIGDPLSCNIAVLFNADTASVSMNNVQPGAVYPFAIVQLLSTNTTCASVFALY